MSCASRLVFGLSLLLIAASTAAGQTADNVLLVINDASPASVEIGEYYAERRQLRDDHIVRLTTSTAETIQRAAFEQTIQAPVATWLSEHRLQDTILYVVLTKGVPIRVFGTGGRDGTVASVDSELTLLYRRMVGTPTTLRGRLPNPYFLGDRPVEAAEPFTRFLSDLYLVTRLDGFTVEDVRGLIDRGMHPATSGQVVLDQRGLPFDPGGDGWMLQAADRLGGTTPGVDVVLEDSPRVAWAEGRVLGYYSWGSNDPANQTRHPDLRFAPGAIGGLFVSTDGRTFAEPPADWQPGVSGRPPGVFGTGSQTLAGDLIRAGMTGLAAHVEEPYLDGTIRPQVLFPAYLSGRSLAESFYLAMPYLSWQTIVIGDPLCAPFRATPLPTSRLARGIDPDTELPCSPSAGSSG
jgi:uncharacterized protein (TIGR03790 family)